MTHFFILGRAVLPLLGESCGAARGISRLRVRPKGAALWNPAAFVKAGETFSCASRSFFQTSIHIILLRYCGICRRMRP